ncbi:MAG TPA: bifunctional demethylmenaquinone methyltransferase/2-methoxy-6-polyprenyl-1,4-benzoquinol methylase UbiE [Bacteroidota bacterium]|nr:bifunctional demethylmenaquinone methyltransferase/2-methoxy-6-polyprenyl-1,4-benzoquinol methylase UbiE [Bacteroidota bacterium]
MPMSPNRTIRRDAPSNIRAMFDSIAPTYDRLNHLLSFGMDIRWRRKAVALLAEKKQGVFLDIAAGSGDSSLELLSLQPEQVIGSDFALSMLNVFDDKLKKTGKRGVIGLISCDAHELPFGDASFDGTMVAFGIRNFADRLLTLKEMHRVLKPTGIAVILELSTPTNPFALQLYRLYAQLFLPLIGKIISRHHSAYRYLPESIAQFPDPVEFLQLLRTAGFGETDSRSLSFGAATIYRGRKK